MPALIRDFFYAIRSLRRAPAFTALAVVTLALGIGANTAIFSVVNGVLLRPLAYADADRLVAIFEDERSPTSPINFLDLRQESRTFEDVTAATPWSPVLRTGDSERPAQLQGLKASPTLFRLLAASAAVGRVFAGGGEAENVVVLGHDLWQRRFGGDRGVVGRDLSLDGETYTVVGVMPPGFAFPPFWATETEFWAPLVLDPHDLERRGARFLRVFARLRPDVTLEHAQAEVTALAGRLAAVYPDDNDGLSLRVEALREPVVSGVRNALWVVLGTVALVLLIACTNVANLFLARASTRRQELAVRTALGAGRFDLLRQLLAESVVLALAAGGVGLLLGSWGIEALVAMSPENIPRLDEIRLDGRVFAFTLGLSLATGLAFGTLPLRSVARWDLRDDLQESSRQPSGRRGGRLRNLLVAAEIALALMLLLGAGLTVKTLANLWRLDPGFRTDGILAMDLPLAGSPHAAPERQAPFFEELLREVGSVPGVSAAALVNHLPIGGDVWGLNFQIEGRRAASRSVSPRATFRTVSPGFFETLDVEIVEGRAFDRRDREDSQPVVIVSRTLAERYFPGESPLGRRIVQGGPDADGPWLEIVGVAEDVRQSELTDELEPGIYFPYRQNIVSWFEQTTLVVYTEGPPAALRSAVESRIWRLDAGIPITNVRTVDEILSEARWRQRFNATLLALFAGLALILAAVGIYGVMSYAVSRRRAEIGIRMALGAGRRQISRLVVRQGLRLALAGAAAGLLGGIVLARFLQSLLFGMSAYDLTTFAAVAGLLTAVALFACYLPARRASRLDPVASLRSE